MTFSPVAKITTVRVLLALATSKYWKLWQMDVKNAFLHEKVDREIYIEQPRGFESKTQQNYVCKLKKALYRLKQAPRAWYGKIAEFLVQSGYIVAHSDSSLFIKSQRGKLAIVRRRNRNSMKKLGSLILDEGIRRTKTLPGA